jgi:hypothetical protein
MDGFVPAQIECCTCGTIASTSSTKCHQMPELLGRIQVKLAKKPGQQLGLGIAGWPGIWTLKMGIMDYLQVAATNQWHPQFRIFARDSLPKDAIKFR